MSYTTNYKDENDQDVEVTITDTMSAEAIDNEVSELMKKYNSDLVSIERIEAEEGSGEKLRLHVTVHAPSHYLTSMEDTEPKPCNEMSVDVIVYPGYPLKEVTARYPSDYYLASPNVFRFGTACIDEWIPFKSSLIGTVDKLVNDIIHNPSVTRYESPANHKMIEWHENNVAQGNFPTINPKLLEAIEPPPLPARGHSAGRTSVTPPPLPPRRQ